eukprot:CAMPEP_0172369124 /NCGR_PEP_ID=MMETSP1060-20121228/31086_1 /TAXON_ID=37318 /ORGANISM="Pseudo-nitzschia pungens, Strain cf. cingulata" /LENGTH=589 /DNA_ID=CAMNT_0013093937 /DNA_START=184 /DNA_END=1953 /DNA_ORIENTATION=+
MAIVVVVVVAAFIASCGFSGVQAFSTTTTTSIPSRSIPTIGLRSSQVSPRFPSLASSTSTSTLSSSLSLSTPERWHKPAFREQQRAGRISTTSLTTTVATGEQQEPTPEQSQNIFTKAAAKFKARPGTYLMIPVIAGFVGWLTNYLAVQMIFYPVQFRGIPIWRRAEVPLGLLGWQGIVPCKTATMSRALVDMVQTQLLTVPEAFARLNPGQVAKHLAGAVPQLGESVIADVAATSAGAATVAPFPLGLWRSVEGATSAWYAGIVRFANVQILKGVVKDLIRNSERIFSLENCVVDQMLLDRAKLGQLFQKVGRVELDFLTNSGLWFGFLLGLIQMGVALVWENPWALSIGGTIVGLATNWLALKWIFEPVYPTKIGPFVVQGMFLKRQKEVAAEFSNFFASKIVTSEQIWNSVLTDPSTTPALSQVLGGHVKKLLSIASLGLFRGLPSPETVGRVTESAITNLPGHLSKGLHKYVDGALGLETTLRTQMEAMSPVKFERVLHPIFEEDELTLIIAGGVLGFIAGLIQQGLETGQLKVPPLPGPIRAWVSRFRSTLKSVANRIKPGDKKEKPNGSLDYDPENGDGVSGE